MVVNGVTVKDRTVLALARFIENPALAHKLQTAHRFQSSVINLGTVERALVLAALDELEALHARLLEHPAWRSSTRVN